ARVPGGGAMRGVVAGMLTLLLAVARGASAATGGPDAFGYTFVDRSAPGGPASPPVAVSTTGMAVLVGTGTNNGDDIAAVVDLTTGGSPGFAFYGVTYSAVAMAANGRLSPHLAAARP